MSVMYQKILIAVVKTVIISNLGTKRSYNCSLTVIGLRSHLDEVQSLIYDNGIHILALNEIKLPPEYPKELTKIEVYQQKSWTEPPEVGGGSLVY